MSSNVSVNSRIRRCNHSNGLKGCVLSSMDVISLYLSIDIAFAVEKCIEIICDSEVEFYEVNTGELGLFKLSYDMTLVNSAPTRSQSEGKHCRMLE